MTKTYKLLIDSPEYPKGTLAVYKDEYLSKSYYAVGTYLIFYPADHEQKLKRGLVYKEAIENRPHIWELQEEKLDLRSPEAILSINEEKTEITYMGKTYILSR